MAEVAKALGDPVRLQLVDVLRKHAGKVCVCELVPLFEISQPTVSHHLKVLREAGIVGLRAPGLWAYYFVIPDALEELSAWLSLNRIRCALKEAMIATDRRTGSASSPRPVRRSRRTGCCRTCRRVRQC